MADGTWEKFADGLRPVGARAAAQALNAGDRQSHHETYRLLVNGLAQGIIQSVYGDADYPDLLPHLNNTFNLAGVVPDYIYKTARLTGNGVYRISGFRGTSRFVDIDVFGGHHSTGGEAFTTGTVTLDDLKLGPDGYFSLLLCNEKPKDYAGDWMKLDPRGMLLLVRFCAYDWKNELDARMAIERLDRPAARPRMPADDIARRIDGLPAWTEKVVVKWLEHVASHRRKGLINRLEHVPFAAGANNQIMYECLFDIGEDEALILETEIPTKVRYWSLMLTDDQLGTLDWQHHQSSLNGHQARLDSDGKFRGVISLKDPGVANWLDTAGYLQGAMQWRWNHANSNPFPTLTKVKFADVRRHLPPDTPMISPEQRDKELRERREGSQLRRRW